MYRLFSVRLNLTRSNFKPKMTARVREVKSTKKQTKIVLHLPYWKPDTKDRFLLIHGSYNCCCMFQYTLLRCAMTFLTREDLCRLYACFMHLISQTLKGWLVRCLSYAQFICERLYLSVPMWTLQSAETKIYSMHGDFVASEWLTHREYWHLMGQLNVCPV